MRLTAARAKGTFPLLRRGVMVLVALVVLVVAWTLYWCRSAVFQSANPLLISFTAARMEATGTDFMPISGARDTWLQRDTGEGYAGRPLAHHLKQCGWVLVDQMGGGLFFKKGTSALRIDCEKYTGRYVLSHVYGAF